MVVAVTLPEKRYQTDAVKSAERMVGHKYKPAGGGDILLANHANAHAERLQRAFREGAARLASVELVLTNQAGKPTVNEYWYPARCLWLLAGYGFPYVDFHYFVFHYHRFSLQR